MRSFPSCASLAGSVQIVASLDQLIAKLTPPRVVWVMVPAGNPTEGVITDLAKLLASGDLIIDGGNSYFKDSQRRAENLRLAAHPSDGQVRTLGK